jgi:hypothetical protein
MSYNFRMVFSGLCAFVHDKKQSLANVLLVNTEHEHMKRLVPDIEEHYPVLRFNLADVQGLNGDSGEGFGVWPLHLEDITFERRKKGSRRPENETPAPPSLRVQNGGEKNDFSNVPVVSDFLKEEVCIHPDCLRENPQLDLAVARVKLLEGMLKVDEFAHFRESDVFVQFVPPMTRAAFKKRPLPHRVALELRVEDDEEVVLRSHMYGKKDSSLREVVLRGSKEKEVEVRVVNLCCGHFLEEEYGPGESPRADEDFASFYLLSESFSKLKDTHAKFPIPIPVKFNTRRTRGQGLAAGGGTIHCTGARFNLASAGGTATVDAVPSTREPVGEETEPGLQGFELDSQVPFLNLCWAAATVSVHRFLGGSDWKDLRQLASRMHLRKDFSMDEVRKWDKSFSLIKALKHTGNLFKSEERPLRLEDVKKDIDAGYPVICLMEDGPGIGHATVITGYQEMAGQEMIYIGDPKTGRFRFFDYDTLIGPGNSRWTESFRTKKVNEVEKDGERVVPSRSGGRTRNGGGR